jgi:hypothetical protein
MARTCRHVILSEVKNLIVSTTYKTEILRLRPQNDIVTHLQGGQDNDGNATTR